MRREAIVFDYKNHLTLGGVSYFAVSYATGSFSVGGLVVACFFSILPDADQLQSKVSQLLFNAPTKLFQIASVLLQLGGSLFAAVWMVDYVSLFSDRRISALLLFLICYIVLEPNDSFIRRRAAESVSLLMLFGGLFTGIYGFACAGSIFLTYTVAGHRSFVSHSLFSLAILYFMMARVYPGYHEAVLIGYGSHLFADHVFDVDRCPLLFPLDMISRVYKSKFVRRDLILTLINLLVVGGLYIL